MKEDATNPTNLNVFTANDLTQMGVFTWYTLLDYVRSRRFLLIFAIELAISIILILIVGNIMYFWGSISLVFALLSGILFGADALAGEFQNKTGYFSVPVPIRRSSIYLGKWLAAYIASGIILSIYAIITLGTGAYYSSVPATFGFSYLFVLLFLAAVLGCVFFFSSLSKSISISIFLDFIVLVLVSMLIQNTAGLVPFEPWFILSYGGQIIGDILMIPYPPHEALGNNPLYPKIGGISTTLYNPTIAQGLLIIGLYFIIPIILGLVFFEKKEF